VHVSDTDYALGVQKLFTLFFVTLGPIKLLGPFARATAMLTGAELRAMALRAAAIAALIAIAGGFLGRALLESWDIPVFALRLTAGLILFVVAFRLVMQHYDPPAPNLAPGPVERPTAMKLVFPMVLTPYGIAAVIVLLALSHEAERTGAIVAVLLAVMLLNLLAMAFVRPILGALAPVLQAVGAVLGVLQLALAVQIILTALRGLGMLGAAS
jgi:small neutral amino acid transporter SnatA (MarC family)